MGRVNYIDYLTDNVDMSNLLNLIVHKRKSFEHEREVRAVIWRAGEVVKKFKDVEGNGLIVPVDTKKLVHEIYVSPNSKPMFRGVVEGLSQTYGLAIPVRQSEVNAPPSY